MAEGLFNQTPPSPLVIDYQRIAKQMREFSDAEYVLFSIFDENGKDFTLVGFDGNESRIKK